MYVGVLHSIPTSLQPQFRNSMGQHGNFITIHFFIVNLFCVTKSGGGGGEQDPMTIRACLQRYLQHIVQSLWIYSGLAVKFMDIFFILSTDSEL